MADQLPDQEGGSSSLSVDDLEAIGTIGFRVLAMMCFLLCFKSIFASALAAPLASRVPGSPGFICLGLLWEPAFWGLSALYLRTSGRELARTIVRAMGAGTPE